MEIILDSVLKENLISLIQLAQLHFTMEMCIGGMTWHAEFMKSLRINMCSWSKHIPSQQSAALDWEQATAQHTQPGAQRLAQLWGSSREGFQMKSPILRAKEFIYFKSVCIFFFFLTAH